MGFNQDYITGQREQFIWKHRLLKSAKSEVTDQLKTLKNRLIRKISFHNSQDLTTEEMKKKISNGYE